MSKNKQIIISAASVAAAFSAVATTHAEQGKLRVPSATSFDQQARASIEDAKTQAIIRAASQGIARTIKIDADLNSAPYAEVAAVIDNLVGLDPTVIDALLGDGDDMTEEERQAFLDALGGEVPEGMTEAEYIDSLLNDEDDEEEGEDVVSEDEDASQIIVGLNPLVTGSSGPLMDSSSNNATYFNCYGNCHSACHGSRGWR